MTYRVEFSLQARAQLAEINLWWAANRKAAPTLVAAELQTLVEQLSASPESGRLHDGRGPVHVRKLLMPRCGYHIYYEIHPNNQVVTVLAVWHVARGRGPRL